MDADEGAVEEKGITQADIVGLNLEQLPVQRFEGTQQQDCCIAVGSEARFRAQCLIRGEMAQA